jgi:putative SOS response-associated peptidase YedK
VCGRFNLTAPGEEIAEAFELDEAPSLRPRYNIAPSQPIAVVGFQPRTGRRGLAELTWGLAPRGAKPGERRLINARSESAAVRPAFREAFRSRRCLVPATGFYEWETRAGERPRPWLFRLAGGEVFAFAGLWEPPLEKGGRATCAILTTDPNRLAEKVHDRMPVILPREAYSRWLDPAADPEEELRPLLEPFPEAAMVAYPVGTGVNSPANDDPSCLAPAPAAPPLP